ncbi:MAG: hypothetical protein LPK85_00160, partial [Gammaproteobacteria bacterium]|nr:hypothetical protein [Gammaproteobacteria bacterium]
MSSARLASLLLWGVFTALIVFLAWMALRACVFQLGSFRLGECPVPPTTETSPAAASGQAADVLNEEIAQLQ